MKFHCWISSLGLVLCLTICKCRSLTISGFVGQDITLPCKYDSGYHGLCDICWMRGSIPSNGCGDQIIYATGNIVTKRSSATYQLNGALQMGDASLTILNARKTDSGLYGCRVHVPGWFNDKKSEVYLDIMDATEQTSTTLEYVTTTTHIPTHGPDSTTQPTNTVSENVITPTGSALTTQEITTPPEDMATKHTEMVQTSGFSTLKGTTMMTYTTYGPVLTTQNDITTISEHVSTRNTETQQTSSTLGNGTTSYTTTHGKRPGASSSEHEKLVNEDIRVLAVILVPVILLVVLVLGISAVCLMSKYRGKFRTAIEIPNHSCANVNYSSLDNSVTLPMN